MVNISPALWEQLKKVPALPPPPGVTSNLENREVPNHFEWIITATLGFTFTTILILIRVYTKFFIIKSHGWEDYTSVLAWIGFIAYVTYDVQCFKAGAGVHQWNIPVTEIGASAKVAMIKQIINCPILYITKLSILLQFNRLFAPHKLGKAYWFIQGVIWINTAYYLAGMLAIIFECTPRSKAWDVFTPGGSCVDIAALIVVGAVINLISDLIMLLIPLFCISSLKLPLRKKIGVSCVFATGALACVTSIMRTVTSVHLVGEQDLSFAYFPVLLWADAELASGIVCGCMPALVPFISHFAPKIQRSLSFFPSLRSYFSSSYYNRRSGGGGGGVIGTASSGTTGPSLPGTHRKSNRQSWGNKIKAKSDYFELTGFSSNTVTVTDDNERDGRVHIKDLESGLQRTNKVPAQDVDSRLQWSPASVRHSEIESKLPNKMPAQDVDSRLPWSPVSVRHPEIESQPPNKHIESGLQWNPVSARHPEIESPPPAMTGRQSQSQSQSPTHHVEGGLQWSPVSVRHPEIESPPPAMTGRKSQSQSQSQSQSPTHHVEGGLQWSPVSVRHPEIESPPPAMTGRKSQSQSQSQSQSPTHHVESGWQWSPVSVSARHPKIESPPPATTGRQSQSQSPTHHVESEFQWSPVPIRHPETELQPVMRTDHRPQLPIKHIDSPLRMHPPSERTFIPPSSSSSSSF